MKTTGLAECRELMVLGEEHNKDKNCLKCVYKGLVQLILEQNSGHKMLFLSTGDRVAKLVALLKGIPPMFH